MATERYLDEDTVTAAVLDRLAGTSDARVRRIVECAVGHLHDVVRETRLTEAEWATAIDFLTRVGQACSGTRQEFILLSDVLGLSQLVVALNHRRSAGATEQTVLGPFHVDGVAAVAGGTDIAGSLAGPRLHVSARVVTLDGAPVAGAAVDVWHAGPEGRYDVQDPGWSLDEARLRAVFRTDTDGRFRFTTVRPSAYPVPTDGPVGELLRASGRTAMRPAHIHFRICAPGYGTVITHVFAAGDPWLGSDAVFGVRTSCIAEFVEHAPDDEMPGGGIATEPFSTLDHTFRLQPVR